MILYDPFQPAHKSPSGAVTVLQTVSFNVDLLRDYESFYPIVLSVRKEDGPWCDYACTEQERSVHGIKRIGTVWEAPEPGIYFYKFQALRADGSVADASSVYQQTVYEKYFTTPDWLRGALMYQVFPDRYRRSGKTPVPLQNKRWVLRDDWGGDPVAGPDENGIVQNNDFFGGDLKGIEESLPYLEELGVSVIYLNPIFQAFSNHRYDTADYMKIDPLLGTTEDFERLCLCARQRGIRIVLDGVFNHTGSHSRYFNKDGAFGDTGAYESRESPYYDWYTFHSWPDEYASWWGIDTLPSLNEGHPDVLDFFIRDADSVIAHWLRLGASGFRLDVADELPDVFLDALRVRVKSIDPDACIIGEVWEDASNKISYGHRRRYLIGDQLDTVMNYPLKDGIIGFLNGRISGSELAWRIRTLQQHYPKPAFETLMNILGTHDTPRIRTVLEEGSTEEECRDKLFCALMIWAMLPGTACLYYGDEIGMKGGRDPMNRRCFEPDRADRAIADHVKRLLAFRKSVADLGRMDLTSVHGDDDTLYFNREGDDGGLFVAVHRGSCRWEKSMRNKAERMIASGCTGLEEERLALQGYASAALYFRKV
jgi:cyclomaltodextrinase